MEDVTSKAMRPFFFAKKKWSAYGRVQRKRLPSSPKINIWTGLDIFLVFFVALLVLFLFIAWFPKGRVTPSNLVGKRLRGVDVLPTPSLESVSLDVSKLEYLDFGVFFLIFFEFQGLSCSPSILALLKAPTCLGSPLAFLNSI